MSPKILLFAPSLVVRRCPLWFGGLGLWDSHGPICIRSNDCSKIFVLVIKILKLSVSDRLHLIFYGQIKDACP